jgi:glycosyltransferase involved in cell wall biosynthesis
MRICLLGDYTGNFEEGMRNIAYHLAKELSKRYEVLPLDPKNILFRDFWKDLKKFGPQMIHYVPGPSIISLMLVKTLKFYTNAKTIISAPHPDFSSFSKRLIPLFKPDLILTQDYETEKMFMNFGCKTKFLPNGVDTEKFVPVSKNVKEKLRKKYQIDTKKFVILHVGHIIKERNLQIFDKIQNKENQVFIVASTRPPRKRFYNYMKTDQKLYESLKKSGCIVWKGYIKNIEEIYALADCYIFPVKKGYSILSPLSALEAMSCNLPVISTKFGGLTRIFEEGEGLFFIDKEEEFIDVLEKIKNTGTNINTKEKVLSYSWKNIGIKLEEIYFELMDGANK